MPYWMRLQQKEHHEWEWNLYPIATHDPEDIVHVIFCYHIVLFVTGTVQQYLGDMSYIVEDSTGYVERIWREDVISDYDDHAPPLKVRWNV